MFVFEIVLLWILGIRVELLSMGEQEDVLFRLCIGDKFGRLSVGKIDWAITLSITRSVNHKILSKTDGVAVFEVVPGVIVVGFFLPGIGKAFRLPVWLNKVLNISLLGNRCLRVPLQQEAPKNVRRIAR